MFRYKKGRPSMTSQVENEVIYYFCKLADNRYSLGKCAQIFKLSKTSIQNKVIDVARRCEQDKEYLQYIIDTYSQFDTVSEALNSFSDDIQPINIENDVAIPDVIGTILNLDLNIRDIAFNLVEVNSRLIAMNEMLNKNIILLNNNPNNTANQDNVSV